MMYLIWKLNMLDLKKRSSTLVMCHKPVIGFHVICHAGATGGTSAVARRYMEKP